MSETAERSVLQKKLETGRATVPGGRPLPPGSVLANAMVRACDKLMELPVQASDVADRSVTQAELLELWPEGSLSALLDGGGERLGLAAIDLGAVAALVEWQTARSLSETAAPERRPTRTDAALCADLLDSALNEFAAELGGGSDAGWAGVYGFSTMLEDLRTLPLLLEDVPHRILSFTMTFEQADRKGNVMIALPQSVAPVAVDLEAPPQEAAEPLPEGAWKHALEANVLQGDVRLSAELFRLSMQIGQVRDFEVGDVLPIPVAAIDGVRLLASDGDTLVAKGRLGQYQGCRALKLGQLMGQDPAAHLPGGPPLEAEGSNLELTDLAQSPGLDGLTEDEMSGADMTAVEFSDPLETETLPELPDLPNLPDLETLPALDGLPDLGTGPEPVLADTLDETGSGVALATLPNLPSTS